MKKPSKKELQELIKLSKSEILAWEKFLKRLKLELKKYGR